MTLVSKVCGSKPLDNQTARCPVCGEPGKNVRIETLQNIVKDFRLPSILDGYCLCLSDKCDVVYFGQQLFYKDDVKVKVWFKEDDSSVPVCYCSDVTEADIIEHVAKRGCCVDIQDIQKHTGANTGKECLTKNPAGT